MPEERKNPIQEIVQPFIDLIHAPRALWGINLAYVLEGMVYFGMLGYLTIYCSEYIFQAIDGADEAAHYMVMVLTAGITIAMFFLGVVADKRGVRFALILAFIFMLVGRCIWAGGPTLAGLEPVRPEVVAGDRVSLHITELETRHGSKTVMKSDVLSNEEADANAAPSVAVDLSSGEGIAPSKVIESRLVRLDRAKLIKGDEQEWTARYGTKPVEGRLIVGAADTLHLYPGSTISLNRAYIASAKEVKKDKSDGESGEKGDKQKREDGKNGDDDDEEDKYESIIRSHWLSDIAAIDTFPVDLAAGEGILPDKTIESWRVGLSSATIVGGEGAEWRVQYGQSPVTARLQITPASAPPLRAGAVISVNSARVVKLEADKDDFAIQVEWPDGFTSVRFTKGATLDAAEKAINDVLIPDLAIGKGLPIDDKFAGIPVRLGNATLVRRIGDQWEIRYGTGPVTARLQIADEEEGVLGAGALISLSNAWPVKGGAAEGGYVLHGRWPGDFAAVDTYVCAEPPYAGVILADERPLIAESRTPVAPDSQPVSGADRVTISELRDMKDGLVDVVLTDARVTYVRNGGYTVQSEDEGPGITVFVSPFGSDLQIVTLIGMLLVVIGYGMYQPAAYAGVRKFTTPKTAAMGFAMLYALMNLGGWLPTFAFMLRDDDYLGLGIPGTFWVYAGFTVLALLITFFVLSKRTVKEAETQAKKETARIEAEEKANNKDASSDKGDVKPVQPEESVEEARVKPHMWLFWVGTIALLLFKGESPWFYSWSELVEAWSTSGPASMVVGRWTLAALVFISPVFIALIPPAKKWIARHPLENGKFAFFIFSLIPVQTLFTYNWLILPPYIKRAFDGWMGEYFEIAANANPILIFIAVPLIAAATMKRNVYNMMIAGTFIMAAPAFLLVLGPHWWTLAGYLLIMTIGEAMWQPRFLQYAAEIAPEGRTGEYMGIAQLPWFLTKVLVPLLYSGRMMDMYCPAEGPKNTELMWFIFACIAMCSTVFLILGKGWLGKDFKTKAD